MLVIDELLVKYDCLTNGDCLRSILRYRINPLTKTQKRLVKERKIIAN